MNLFEKDKIFNCVFTNATQDTIEVVYNEGTIEEPNLISIYVNAIELDQPDLQSLFDIGWNFEKIFEHTKNYNREQKRNYKTLLRKAAKEEIEKLKEEQISEFEKIKFEKLSRSNIFEAIEENNEDEEAVFRLKLQIFETAAKGSMTKAKKQKIRSAKTVKDVLKAYL